MARGIRVNSLSASHKANGAAVMASAQAVAHIAPMIFYSAAGRSSSSGAVFDFTRLSAIARAASLAVSHK